jgi:hypothetical protein
MHWGYKYIDSSVVVYTPTQNDNKKNVMLNLVQHL